MENDSLSIDVLVTGGTGLIGRWLLARLSGEGRRVAVLVRGGEKRREDLAAFVDGHGGNSHLLVLVDADLGVDAPIACDPAMLSGVRDVFHLAGAFSFGMDAEDAIRINVGGCLRVAELARSLPRLRRLVVVGGYRSTRLPTWLEEASYPFSASVQRRLYKTYGAYEASKLHAHRALGAFAEEHGLPLTGVHPSTVIGSSTTGETSQQTGLGETVERLWRGRMPAMVGTSKTFVPIVCVDYLAAFLASVPENDATLGQELCVLDPRTPNLPTLIQHIAAHLGVTPPTRIVSKGLIRALPELLTGVEKETLTFLSDDRYDTRAAEAHAEDAGLEMPDWKRSLQRWLDYLVATRFLKDPPRSGHFVSAAGSQTYVVGDLNDADTLFLHGLPWDAHSGDALAESMQASVFAMADLPGMGRSSRAEGRLDEWLEALLAERSRPIRIVAHSLSCGAALRYALRRPEGVREVVLISPFFLQAPAPWWMRFAPLTARLLCVGDAQAFGKRLIGDAPIHDAVISAHAHLRRRGVAKSIAQALSRASRQEERAALVAALGSVEMPVVIVHGASDPLVGETARDTFVVEGAGHNPHVARPQAVAACIERWRGQREPAGPAELCLR